MNDDPFASFRRTPAPAAAAKAATKSGREPYEAFASKDNQRRGRVDIRRKDGFAHAIGYNFLIEICCDRRDWKSILLVASTVLVKIRGRNLRPVADALLLGSCQYIQEFTPEQFDAPEDAAAPYVESIEVINASAQRAERDKKD
jgi:hypothetical protein